MEMVVEGKLGRLLQIGWFQARLKGKFAQRLRKKSTMRKRLKQALLDQCTSPESAERHSCDLFYRPVSFVETLLLFF